MTLETEAVLDRRRLRRRLSLWRTLAVLAGLLAIGFMLFSSADRMGLLENRHIARVTIEGVITEDRDLLRLLQKIGEAKHVSGVIVAVNSPGGTTAGGEALFEALRTVAKTKPVVAQFGTVATSAAYIAGLATDQIVARGNTITGSVGVIFQWPEFTQLLEKLGIKVNEIKSGPLKANPSPFLPLDDAGRSAAEEMVAESQRWFLDLVRTRRNIDTKSVAGLEAGPRLLRPRCAQPQADRPDRRRGRGREIPRRPAQCSQRPQDRGLEGEPGYVMELCTVGDHGARAPHRHSGARRDRPHEQRPPRRLAA